MADVRPKLARTCYSSSRRRSQCCPERSVTRRVADIRAERESIQSLAKESMENMTKANEMFDTRISDLKAELERAEGQSSAAKATAE